MKRAVPITPDFGLVAKGWEKWEQWLQPCYISLNEDLLNTAGLRQGDSVLDLGCGSGQPAILIAQRVGAAGRVVGLDLSKEMLEIARRRASELGLTNLHFQQQDVSSLPFPDASFDCVTARFSLMFLTSPDATLREVHRVVRTGGSFVACVWGAAEKNPLPRNVLKRYYELSDDSPEIPAPFRFGRPGTLAQSMREAGFNTTVEREIFVKEIFLDGLQYLTHLLESSGTWRSLLLKLEEQKLHAAKHELIMAAEQFRSGDHLEIPRCALILLGRKL